MLRSLRVSGVVASVFFLAGIGAPPAIDVRLAYGEEKKQSSNLVELRDEKPWNAAATQTFVISPGLGGCCVDDRFARLAAAISAQFPDANVVRVDWSQTACQRRFGILSPWKVAANIDDVAAEAAGELRERDIVPSTVTLIGESFGNYVNYKIATALGGVKHVLAFNPASEFGGYKPPDLKRCASQTWSFHTYSPYDTSVELAHSELFLETPTDSDCVAQHTFGIVWLAQQVDREDFSWLLLKQTLPARKNGAYCGKATLTGSVEDIEISRERPLPETLPPATDSYPAPSALVTR